MDLNQPPPCDQTLSSILRTLLQILADPLSDGGAEQALESKRGLCISDGHTGCCFLSSAFLWDAPSLRLSLWFLTTTAAFPFGPENQPLEGKSSLSL